MVAIVAIHPSHAAAEAAIKELQQGGFDMTQLSLEGAVAVGSMSAIGERRIAE
jgi:hypothetical protein